MDIRILTIGYLVKELANIISLSPYFPHIYLLYYKKVQTTVFHMAQRGMIL